VFDYFIRQWNWHINDAGDVPTTVSGITTGASGMIVSFTLDTTTPYVQHGPGGVTETSLLDPFRHHYCD